MKTKNSRFNYLVQASPSRLDVSFRDGLFRITGHESLIHALEEALDLSPCRPSKKHYYAIDSFNPCCCFLDGDGLSKILNKYRRSIAAFILTRERRNLRNLRDWLVDFELCIDEFHRNFKFPDEENY